MRRAGAGFLLVGLLAAAPARADFLGRSERDPDIVAGRAALEDGFYEHAQQRFQAYIDKAFFKRNKAKGSLLLAQALMGQRRFEEAAKWLTEHRDWASGDAVEGGFDFWLARAQFELGQYHAVTATLHRFERNYPDDPNLTQAARLRAHAYIRLGDRERALKSFASFQERYPQAPETPDNLLDWAQLLIEDERRADAEELLGQLLQQHPRSPAADTARLWLGRLLMDRGEFTRALEQLDTLARPAEADPDVRAEAYAALARIAVARTNVAAAIDAYEQSERVAEDVALRLESRISRAALLARAGDGERAVGLLEGAVKSAPTHPRAGEAQLQLAQLLLDQEQPARALAAYQSYLEAFADPPGQARALLGKGWCLWFLGRYAEAAAVFEKATPLQPDEDSRETALLKAADAYFANGQFKLAEEAYGRVVASRADGPRAPQALFQAGECQARLHEYDRAEATFRRLRQVYSGDALAPRAAMRLAGLREEQGLWDDAVRDYNEVMRTYTGTNLQAEALHRSALALYRGGEFGAALERFERVLRDYPDTPWGEQSFYLRGWTLHLLGETRRGMQIAQQFLEKFPRSAWAPEVSFWIAEQQFNAGAYDRAEQGFQDLVKKFPQSELADDALFWAGRAAAAQTEFRRAISAFNDLTRTYTNSDLLAEARFAQGDALSELGEFSGAILAFDDIVRRFPGTPLADRAWGRIGDCQFTLGGDKPERLQDAIASYRAILDSPGASADLKQQAHFKIGRCHEKAGRRNEAFDNYMTVVYGWLAARDGGAGDDPVWFARAAFNAAALKEADQQWEEAIRIYERVRDAGIPAGADAEKRIQKITADRVSPAGDGANGKASR